MPVFDWTACTLPFGDVLASPRSSVAVAAFAFWAGPRMLLAIPATSCWKAVTNGANRSPAADWVERTEAVVRAPSAHWPPWNVNGRPFSVWKGWP